MLSLTRVSLARGKRLLARDLDLQLDRPGLNVLHGASGCGKSSLLRLLKGLLAPAAGERHLASGMREADIGLLLPDPQNQLLSDTVLGDLSLPLRYRGLPRERILERCETLGRELGLLNHFSHHPRTLSGGMQQLLCLGAILIQEPRVLLLDEVCTFLDREHRARLAEIVRARSATAAVLQVSHRAEVALAADRLLELCPTGLRESDRPSPDSPVIQTLVSAAIPHEQPLPAARAGEEGPWLALEALQFQWPDACVVLFDRMSARLPLGQGCLLTGNQEAGKSTLILLAAGLLQPTAGRIGLEHGQALPLFQFSEKQFTGDILEHELLEGRPEETDELHSLWERAGLKAERLLGPARHLASGERRLAALVSLLLLKPAALLLDEPFTGLDASGVRRLRSLLADWRDRGGGLLVATHDPELVADLCSSHWKIGAGELISLR
ncbi:MAG: ATP-binding cassette domain-containing protein [Calditrichaeota bacterium]|nr:ATP-binding cassette domain-containing protein [Calditrichota bacterium]